MDTIVELEAPASIPGLVARVIDRHHAYLRRSLPDVSRLVAKIAEVHGPRVPELADLRETVEALRAALERDMTDEETRFFPALMTSQDPAAARAGLRALAATREEVQAAVERIRALTGEYRAPEGACRTWVRALVELEDLENDLGRHLALEDRLRERAFTATP
ncbi:MAG TPA: hemerythrin domain-containing protein [Anaeromyxobacteraceae bacterium]|nr:hemerythrin domain-containing protein [Anaeromyxobacteraceae bacterium]